MSTLTTSSEDFSGALSQGSDIQSSDSQSPRPQEPEPSNSKYDLSSILRYFGGLAVVLSLLSFLLKGWAGSDDLFKFSLLLASTTSIAAIALIIAQYLKEVKSPRLLLSLALVAVPINFSILGAFILYATSSTGGVTYPDYLAWTIGSPLQAFMATAIGVVLLVPVVWLGFRTLSRGLSNKLTVSFLVSNLLLLVPIREPMFVAIVAAALAVIALLVGTQDIRKQVESKTKEGRLALLIQLIPLGILIGRNLWLYSSDQLVLLAGSGLLFLLLRQISMVLDPKSSLRAWVNFFALLPVAVSLPLVVEVLTDIGIAESMSLVFATLVGAGMCYEISCRQGAQTILYRVVGSILACLGSAIVVFGYEAVFSSALVSVAGAGLLALGMHHKERALTLTGALLVSFASVDVIAHLFTFFDLGVWLTLMLVGVAAIVAASLLDTYGQRLRGKASKRGREFAQWNF